MTWRPNRRGQRRRKCAVHRRRGSASAGPTAILAVCLAITGCVGNGLVPASDTEQGPDSRRGDPNELLADLHRWQAASSRDRREAARVVAGQAPDFRFMGLRSFSAARQSIETALYMHEPTGMEFVLVPGGEFIRGSTDPGRAKPRGGGRGDPDESPHLVRLTHAFLMCRTEVPQGVWTSVTDTAPSEFRGASLPVESISWSEAHAFCTDVGLSLPTEAQWEYACRGGTTTRYATGDDAASLDGMANISDRTRHESVQTTMSREGNDPDVTMTVRDGFVNTAPVASFPPNALGLHDMHGNVEEWCLDAYYDRYPKGPVTDPLFDELGAVYRMVRGGCWANDAPGVRSASRSAQAAQSTTECVGLRPVFVIVLRRSTERRPDRAEHR